MFWKWKKDDEGESSKDKDKATKDTKDTKETKDTKSSKAEKKDKKEKRKKGQAAAAPATATAATTTAAGGSGDGDGDGNGARDGDDASSNNDNVVDKRPPEKKSKRQWVRQHCARFWLWYLIGVIIFLAILLPILFLVIIPAIVQAILNSQDLPVYSGALKAIDANRAMLSLNTSLNTPLPVTIDELPLYLYNKNTTPFTPFVTLTLASQRVSGDTPAVITNQTVEVGNKTELVKWFNSVFDQDDVELSVRADPTIHLGALKSTPRLDKTITLPGLNSLKGFGIRDLTVMLPPRDGNNIKGNLNLPNPGILALDIGNLSLNLFSGTTRLGLVTLYDLTLPSGNNTRYFDGNIFLDAIVPNLGAILASQAAPLGRGVIELNATGNATIVNGQHIDYLEEVLNAKKLTFSISIVTLISEFLSGLVNSGSGGTGTGSSIIDVLGDVLGNSTFLTNAIDHWNLTAAARRAGAGANSIEDLTKLNAKRAAARGSMVWSMLKLGMKLKRAQLS